MTCCLNCGFFSFSDWHSEEAGSRTIYCGCCLSRICGLESYEYIFGSGLELDSEIAVVALAELESLILTDLVK